MMKLRRRVALLIAGISGKILRLLPGKGGGTLPGYLAGKLDPEILPFLAGSVREKIIVTMGTNGKTTVNSILVHVLESEGKKVITNRTGANMRNGVICAFALADRRDGRPDADYACIEVDEFAAPEVLPQLGPDCVILTNLFRDQLDRYGEPDRVAARVREALLSVPHARLILNCDDPFSGTLGDECPNPVMSFGINGRFPGDSKAREVRDGGFCRFCGEKLAYDFFHYGQLGSWRCPGCGRRREEPDCCAEHIRQEDFSFDLDGRTILCRANSPYNVYNMLSACAALRALGVSPDRIEGALESFDYGNHREGTFWIKNTRVQLHLAKNPVGFQQKLEMLCRDTEPKDLVIRLGDASQDGRDVSWLWDVDFGQLRKGQVGTLIVSGSRRHDMALRLKYENIPCRAAGSMRRAIAQLTGEGTGNLYVIVNYSGLFKTNRMLKRLSHGCLRNWKQQLSENARSDLQMRSSWKLLQTKVH